MADLNIYTKQLGTKFVNSGNNSEFTCAILAVSRYFNENELRIVYNINGDYDLYRIDYGSYDNIYYNSVAVASIDELQDILERLSSGLVDATTSPNFHIKAPLGLIPGVSVVSKSGNNPSIDIGSPEDIWSFGGLYTFSTSAIIDSISSSDVADTQQIQVEGLDANYDLVIQLINLNGQNRVVLPTPLLRCFGAFNNNSLNLAGDVYIYENTPITGGVPDDPSKVRAYIEQDAQQTEMIIYTVPNNKTLVYTEGHIALSKSIASAAVLTLRSRLIGKIFRVKRSIALNSQGTGTWRAVYSVARVLPSKTDLLFRCDEVSNNNTGVSGGFEGYLFDNTIWGL